MNILQQEDMVKGLPDEALIQEAEQPSGQLPQYLLISEVQRRADMRKRHQQQMQEAEPTVAEQVLQEGIAGLASPPEQMQQAMNGGPPMNGAPPQMPPQMSQQMPPGMNGGFPPQLGPQMAYQGGVVRMQGGRKVESEYEKYVRETREKRNLERHGTKEGSESIVSRYAPVALEKLFSGGGRGNIFESPFDATAFDPSRVKGLIATAETEDDPSSVVAAEHPEIGGNLVDTEGKPKGAIIEDGLTGAEKGDQGQLDQYGKLYARYGGDKFGGRGVRPADIPRSVARTGKEVSAPSVFERIEMPDDLITPPLRSEESFKKDRLGRVMMALFSNPGDLNTAIQMAGDAVTKADAEYAAEKSDLSAFDLRKIGLEKGIEEFNLNMEQKIRESENIDRRESLRTLQSLITSFSGPSADLGGILTATQKAGWTPRHSPDPKEREKKGWTLARQIKDYIDQLGMDHLGVSLDDVSGFSINK